MTGQEQATETHRLVREIATTLGEARVEGGSDSVRLELRSLTPEQAIAAVRAVVALAKVRGDG